MNQANSKSSLSWNSMRLALSMVHVPHIHAHGLGLRVLRTPHTCTRVHTHTHVRTCVVAMLKRLLFDTGIYIHSKYNLV